MRHNININQIGQSFSYVVEYNKNSAALNRHNIIPSTDINGEYVIKWCNDSGIVRLYTNDILYYRCKNDWYNKAKIQNWSTWSTTNIPDKIKTSNLKLYIPNHTPSSYVSSIKYALNLNTWLNGHKIDLGTYLFRPTDTLAIPDGNIKIGNNEYHEYISFDIIDPFYLIYSDEWDSFRKSVCSELNNTNLEASTLYVSLYVVDEYEDNYIMYEDCIGGYTNFNISNDEDYLSLNLSISNKPLGFKFDIHMNEVYDDFINYLYETYNISNVAYNQIILDLVIKNKDSIIFDPTTAKMFIPDIAEQTFGNASQIIPIIDIKDTTIKNFFTDWSSFEDGWSIVGSLTVYDKCYYNEDGIINNDLQERLSLVSNEIPITQEIFSIFTNGGSEQIIDIVDMNINTFNVVNKIENKIISTERPNDHSNKSNIVQPVFFRAKETEILTLHPMVTENISINLDDYKSKVNHFILQIGDSTFDQIGANSYGILFKIKANTLPKVSTSGIYYVLDENKELVTTGKYNCVI